jgi:hypothetical protein
LAKFGPSLTPAPPKWPNAPINSGFWAFLPYFNLGQFFTQAQTLPLAKFGPSLTPAPPKWPNTPINSNFLAFLAFLPSLIFEMPPFFSLRSCDVVRVESDELVKLSRHTFEQIFPFPELIQRWGQKFRKRK